MVFISPFNIISHYQIYILKIYSYFYIFCIYIYIFLLYIFLFSLCERYTLAAQDLLMRSRGVLKERGWRLPNDRLGSGDDITVFVIPLAGAESET